MIAIMDHVKNGFAIKLTKQEVLNVGTKSKYLIPHHPVFKHSFSSSTKSKYCY